MRSDTHSRSQNTAHRTLVAYILVRSTSDLPWACIERIVDCIIEAAIHISVEYRVLYT
jgi:hypothetical protein